MDLLEARETTEIRHPWEPASASFFDRLAVGACPPVRPVRVLEAGYGDAWFRRQTYSRSPRPAFVKGSD